MKNPQRMTAQPTIQGATCAPPTPVPAVNKIPNIPTPTYSPMTFRHCCRTPRKRPLSCRSCCRPSRRPMRGRVMPICRCQPWRATRGLVVPSRCRARAWDRSGEGALVPKPAKVPCKRIRHTVQSFEGAGTQPAPDPGRSAGDRRTAGGAAGTSSPVISTACLGSDAQNKLSWK